MPPEEDRGSVPPRARNVVEESAKRREEHRPAERAGLRERFGGSDVVTSFPLRDRSVSDLLPPCVGETGLRGDEENPVAVGEEARLSRGSDATTDRGGIRSVQSDSVTDARSCSISSTSPRSTRRSSRSTFRRPPTRRFASRSIDSSRSYPTARKSRSGTSFATVSIVFPVEHPRSTRVPPRGSAVRRDERGEVGREVVVRKVRPSVLVEARTEPRERPVGHDERTGTSAPEIARIMYGGTARPIRSHRW